MDVDSHVRLSQLIVERCKRLAEMGQDVSWLLPGLRRLTMNQYLAFYSISDSPKSVIVERVLHAMRDVDPLIGEEQDKP